MQNLNLGLNKKKDVRQEKQELQYLEKNLKKKFKMDE